MNARHRNMSGISRRGKNFPLMQIPVFGQTIIPRPSVRAYDGSFGHDVTDKWLETSARGIWNVAHPDSSKPFRFLDLNSYHNDRLARTSPSLTTLLDSTNKGFVDFNRPRQLAPFTTNHRHAVPLKHRPCRSIAGAKRLFQCLSRQSILCGCQMPSGFKPSRQRCSRLFHDRTSRHGCLVTTCSTNQSAPRLTPRLSGRLGCRTAKTDWPPQFLPVGCTRSFIGDLLDELPERVGEINPIGQIVSHVSPGDAGHTRHNSTGGANRLPRLY